jgi:tRNA(Ile)-lysidine synthase
VHSGENVNTWKQDVLQELDALSSKGVSFRRAKILLAVSGGVDSMALLHFWQQQGVPHYQCSLGVAHVHHGLRGESDLEYAYVEKICEEQNIPFYGTKLDPRQSLKESVEMWGRRERYRFFEKLQKKYGFSYVFTAHHQDDQLETLFLRLWRGTGVKGLQGVHYYRSPNIIRPFLFMEKDVLRRYCLQENVSWWEDRSNQDLGISRNWFRYRYLSRQENIGKLRQTTTYITKAVQDLLPKLERFWQLEWDREKAYPCLPSSTIKKWMNEDPLLYFNDFAHLVLASGGALEEATYEEWIRQWKQGVWPVRVCIGGNQELLCDSEGCRVRILETSSQKVNLKHIEGFGELEWDISSHQNSIETTWGSRKVRLSATRLVKYNNFILPKKQNNLVFLDGKQLTSKLIVRVRKDGDLFSPLGTLSKTRKLKKYLNEQKVPLEKRKTHILICDENNASTVVWVPSLNLSEYYKVTPETDELLKLEIQWL